jgi:hypothetical protein
MKGMSMPLKKIYLCMFAALLAISAATTGCQSKPDETVVYNKWEVETHREHKDINQRPAEEQKEYHDWRDKHANDH